MATSTKHTNASATLMAGAGKSAAYAAAQQFGAQTGRGHKSTIPPRPYMPIEKRGGDFSVTDKTKKAILEMALKFVENESL